ncbi:uncharacterized protein LOC108215176 isoform X8 [Daucus carota subsp. sativus]|uniref:uncharacterized protein LOC108215176 isoform X8 n=1 Tax=Daucus carota subsp. sativus TaxID=79200 RepID=UPI0007EFE8C8|nr:PREDICTED: uncharacterized protein LOC108215176 isoform X3 [Daucus carota subsp. sativus]
MDLNGFEPIFKQPKTEWSDPNFSPLRSFIVCVDAPDSTELRIQATDFHSNSWMTILSVDQLDDMRDTTGIGGSWSEFLAYVAASIQSEETKLGFEGKSEVDGPAYAKLIAQKTKGLPKISFPLDKLEAAAATEVRRNVSLALFGAFDTCQSLLVKEREAGQKLKELIAAEQVQLKTSMEARKWVQVKLLIALYQHTAGQKLEEFFCKTPKMMQIIEQDTLNVA